MGVALEWEPWNWDLWNTPLEPDERTVASLRLFVAFLLRPLLHRPRLSH